MQSLVPSLSLINLIPFSIFFSFVYLSLDKNSPLRIGKNKNPLDWQIGTPPNWPKWDHSGLVKILPLLVGKNKTPPDWQNLDPSELAKLGPLRIGKNSFSGTFKIFTLYPSGYVLRCSYAVGTN